MRQAGRYLPEYRETRRQAGSFLDLCYTPKLAAEVTLQPIRRYAFDASIMFSDILVVPHALGRKLWFEEGSGPRLEPLAAASDVPELDEAALHDRLTPVYETLDRLTQALPDETALIGFAGAPWTLATYMIEGGSSKDFLATKRWAYGDPESFGRLIDVLVESVSSYLTRQVQAGAEALQLFDSWAGNLAADEQRRWSLNPLARIVDRVKSEHPNIPLLVFPRLAGVNYKDFAAETGADGLSLDSGVPLEWAARELQPLVTVQGNLDPALLVAGGAALDEGVARIRSRLEGGPHIFNLGHGVAPQTPPEHVARLVEQVRKPSSGG
jgi:uroporphyrinogen decarboxylase